MNVAALGDVDDCVGILEAACSAAPDVTAWAGQVVDAASSLFGERDWLGLHLLEHDPPCASGVSRLRVGGASAVAFSADIVEKFPAIGVAGVRELFYPASQVVTQLEIDRRLPAESAEYMRRYRASLGVYDGLGVLLHPDPGLAAVLFAGYPSEVVLTRHQRRILSQVALHVEAGLRLRLRPECVKAVISPTGAILDRFDGAPHRERLAAHVKRVERTRLRRHRKSPEALDVWTALVDGRMSLVEHVEGARRYYLVVDNPLASQPLRSLTKPELDVVSQAATGLTAKLVAYSLGISEPTVSSRLASAARKIGVATRLELVRLAAMLARDPRARFEAFALTTAERDVLDLLSLGLSNREIGLIRNRSVRTIANQVATLLRKTNSASRRALVARAVKRDVVEAK
jgi:DNA-binding CsgD family transcriptional regulator